MTRIALLVPAPFDTVSGGYGYDRAIVAGLRAAGHDVDVLEIDGTHPLPDATAQASARDAWQRVAADAVPVIDGLGLPAFAALGDGGKRVTALKLLLRESPLAWAAYEAAVG